jgi:hypothetical protein
MKNIILGLAIATITLAGCNSNKSTEVQNSGIDTQAKPQSDNSAVAYDTGTMNVVSIKEIVNIYLQLKNCFVEDNTTDAATVGTRLKDLFKNFDKTALTAAQMKTFEDVQDDAIENAEHIGENGGNIAHQREHFELLSKDIYDLIKAFGSEQVLYNFFCPMYNNGEGAFWISETKEIENPYFGKEMPTCGTLKEEIK